MELSIVTTLYKSSPYIDEFYARISKEAQKITDDYEIIFVDDGSPDDSLQKAVALYEKDSKVKVIELSRNFGHHKAIMTGLSHAKGEFVFLIDSDLEEEPELLGKFWEELHKEKELDVVYGVQKTRKGGWFERWSGKIFIKLFNLLSDVKIPKNFITARLFTKKAKESLLSYNERELCLGCMYYDIGFNQKEVVVTKLSHSPTTYTFSKKINVMFNSIVSFSSKPLIYIFYFGLTTFVLSCFYIVKILIDKFYYEMIIEGWTSVIISVWLFGSLTIMNLGIIGIYLSKIFIEVKQRPYTIIKHLYESDNNE